MFKFIHLTDTHLVPPSRRLYGLDPLKRLQAAVGDIEEKHADAAFVAVTGDLTHWGQVGAYKALADTFGRLSMPVHLTVGNHDHRGRFSAAFPNTPIDDAGFVQHVHDTPVGQFVFLDTMNPDRADGELCPLRLGWLAEVLERETGPFFLFQHHPPFDSGIQLMDGIRLAKSESFWSVIAPHRNRIRHLFFGHLHRPLSGSWRGIPMSTLWSTNHQVDLVLGHQDTLAGTQEQPAYAVVMVNDDTVLVHTHHYLDRSPKYDFSDDQVRDTDRWMDTWLVDPEET